MREARPVETIKIHLDAAPGMRDRYGVVGDFLPGANHGLETNGGCLMRVGLWSVRQFRESGVNQKERDQYVPHPHSVPYSRGHHDSSGFTFKLNQTLDREIAEPCGYQLLAALTRAVVDNRDLFTQLLDCLGDQFFGEVHVL